jgi:hypothetical protein
LPTAVTVTTSQASRRVFRSRDAELPLLYISCPGAGRLTDPVPRIVYCRVMWRRVALDSRRRCWAALPGTRAGSEERGRSRSGMQQLKGEAKAEAAASGCAICLEASPSDTLVLPCAHSFCRGCIN